jgi:hypothetical protein
VTLPYLMRLYRRDFGGTTNQVRFAAGYLPAADAAWLRDDGGFDGRVAYGRCDWTIAV